MDVGKYTQSSPMNPMYGIWYQYSIGAKILIQKKNMYPPKFNSSPLKSYQNPIAK